MMKQCIIDTCHRNDKLQPNLARVIIRRPVPPLDSTHLVSQLNRRIAYFMESLLTVLPSDFQSLPTTTFMVLPNLMSGARNGPTPAKISITVEISLDAIHAHAGRPSPYPCRTHMHDGAGHYNTIRKCRCKHTGVKVRSASKWKAVIWAKQCTLQTAMRSHMHSHKRMLRPLLVADASDTH